MSRRALLTLAVLAAVLAAAAAWWFTRAVSVPAIVLHQAPLVRSLQFSARVATASRVDVGSTLTGRVQQVAVAEGAKVGPDQLLVQLETDELNAALKQAQAGERQAVARLAGLRGSGRGVATAGVAQADSVLVAARADLQRTQDLLSQGFVSEARLDDARRALAVAQAQRDAAAAQNAAVGDQGSDVAQAQAQVTLARAGTAAAEARLAQARITAPAEARVLARLVEPGQIVQPGKALLRLSLAGPMQAVAQVDERYLDQLRIGQQASVLADAYATQRFAATVLSIAPLVDAQRAAVEVKLALPEPPAFLREDMTLSVELETARLASALVVPVAALLPAAHTGLDPGRAQVWVARDGRAEAREVSLGLRTLDAVEVSSGLSEGEVVLLAPTLKSGARVRPDSAARAVRAAPGQGAGQGGEGAAAMTNSMGR